MTLDNFHQIRTVLGKDNVRRFFYLIPLDIVSSLLETISISIIIPFVVAISDKDRVLTSKYGAFVEANFDDYNDFLLIFVIILILISFASALLSIYSNSRKITLVNTIGQKVGQIQYRKYLYAEYRFHSRVNTTELSKNLMTEVSRFTNNVLIASVMLISKIFFLLMILGFMLTINPGVSITIIFSLSMIYILIFKALKNKLWSNGKQISKSITHLYSIINESLTGIKETKFYGLEHHYSDKYVTNSDSIAGRTSSSQIISTVPKSAVEFILFASLLSMLILLNKHGILIDNLPIITFFLYAGYRALPALQQVYNSLTLIRANYESVNRILEFDNLIENDDDGERLTQINSISEIRFEDVCFRYDDNRDIFKNFSSVIAGPALVAVVGRSGVGKSTLIDLLLKLNQPSSGAIFINEQRYSYGDARQIFAYVPQNIHLADSTLLENICLGDIHKPINQDLVDASIKSAGLESFIRDLPEGVHTQVGENGSALSGGQRKRLSLARAFYSEKSVLILDEVTSGLDAVTEANVLSDLKEMSRTKLIILVTHSSQRADLFDRIIDLSAGEDV